jgi:predicted phage tail protein
MLRKIQFHRGLKDDLCLDSIMLDVDNSQQLMLGLNCVIPDFKQVSEKYDSLSFCVEGKKKVKKANIKTGFANAKTIHVVPTIEGDFVVAAVAEYFAISYAVAFVVTIAINMALSMALSAIAQSLASKPSTGSGSTAPQTPSFIFNGPINVTSQGGAVPIAYGTCIVGSTVIAADLLTIDIPITS